jgi:hypothetical protein
MRSSRRIWKVARVSAKSARGESDEAGGAENGEGNWVVRPIAEGKYVVWIGGDAVEPVEPGRNYYQEHMELRQSCLDDGLLTSAFGRGNLRITKKGRKVVKYKAVTDEVVADALQEALRTPWLERREALVAVVLVAKERLSATDEDVIDALRRSRAL